MKRSLILFALILLLSQTFMLTSKTAAQDDRMDAEGRIEVKYEHLERGASRTVYYLNTGSERLELRVKPGTSLTTGAPIRVSGRMRGGSLSVEHAEAIQVAEITSANHSLGEQRQLVMLFNFQDAPTNRPWTAAYIQDLLFNQVNAYWQHVSYAQTWISGEFTGWYTIPINSTDCQSNMRQAAEDGARALGYNPDSYSHKIYLYPSGGCRSRGGSTWTGTDSSGNFTSSTYLCGTATLYSLGHEFGHTLGLSHSNSLNCNGTTFGTNCTHSEYGDDYDVMGYYNTGAVNAYQRDVVGWLGTRLQTVSSSGTYTLSPLSVADSNLKALRIPQSYDPTTGSTTFYYVEYRQPLGYDSFLSGYSGVTNGVLLHLGTIGNDVNRLLRGSELLDGTPTLTGANEALAVGRSFYDPALPVTVTVLSANGTEATVSVQFSGPTCVPTNPTVRISPSDGLPSAPGTPVPYTVTVSNNDGSACTSSSFSLRASIPAGWTATFANPSLAVSPGGSSSTTLTVTSPSSAANGFYDVGVTATSSSSASSGSASASYEVASALNVAVSTDRSSYTRKQSVTMMAMVSANGSPVQGVGVSFTMTKSNGAVVTQSATTGTSGSASVRFQTRKNDPVGTYQGRGAANSNGASGSAATTFTVR